MDFKDNLNNTEKELLKNFLKFTKKFLPKIILVLITFLVIYTWFCVIDIKGVVENFKKFRPLFALGASLTLLFVHFLNSLCLKLLIDSVKKVNLLKLFQIYLAGAFINSLGGIQHVGLAVELYLFYKILGVPVATSVSAFGIMKLLNLGVTFFPLIFLPFVKFRIHNVIKFGISFAGILFLFLIIFIFLMVKTEKKWLKIFEKLLFIFPENFKKKFLNFFSSIFNSLKMMGKSKINILFAVIILLFIPIINLAGGGFAFFSFPFEVKKTILELNRTPVEMILSVIIGQSILSILFSLPSLPAQLGTMEWYVWIVFVWGFGFPENIISTLTLLLHPLYFFTTAIAGGIATFMLGIKLSLLKEEMLNFSKSPKLDDNYFSR